MRAGPRGAVVAPPHSTVRLALPFTIGVLGLPLTASAQPTLYAAAREIASAPGDDVAQCVAAISVAAAALVAVGLARPLPRYDRTEGQLAGLLVAGVTFAFNLGYMAHGFVLDAAFNYVLAGTAWLAPLWVGWHRWRARPTPPPARNEGLRTE